MPNRADTWDVFEMIIRGRPGRAKRIRLQQDKTLWFRIANNNGEDVIEIGPSNKFYVDLLYANLKMDRGIVDIIAMYALPVWQFLNGPRAPVFALQRMHVLRMRSLRVREKIEMKYAKDIWNAKHRHFRDEPIPMQTVRAVYLPRFSIRVKNTN